MGAMQNVRFNLADLFLHIGTLIILRYAKSVYLKALESRDYNVFRGEIREKSQL